MLQSLKAFIESLGLSPFIVALLAPLLTYWGNRSNARRASQATTAQAREAAYYAALERRLEMVEGHDATIAGELQDVRLAVLACMADRNALTQQSADLTARLKASDARLSAHVAASTVDLASANARIAALVGTNELLVASNERMVLRLLALEREVSDPTTPATLVERVGQLEAPKGNGG